MLPNLGFHDASVEGFSYTAQCLTLQLYGAQTLPPGIASWKEAGTTFDYIAIELTFDGVSDPEIDGVPGDRIDGVISMMIFWSTNGRTSRVPTNYHFRCQSISFRKYSAA